LPGFPGLEIGVAAKPHTTRHTATGGPGAVQFGSLAEPQCMAVECEARATTRQTLCAMLGSHVAPVAAPGVECGNAH